MKPQIKQFLISNSPSEGLFIYGRNNEYIFNKGTMKGMSVNNIYQNYPDEFIEYMTNLYHDGNWHTKSIVIDIFNILKIKNIKFNV